MCKGRLLIRIVSLWTFDPATRLLSIGEVRYEGSILFVITCVRV